MSTEKSFTDYANLHEAWREQKSFEGYTYSPEHSEQELKSPFMTPFDQMSTELQSEFCATVLNERFPATDEQLELDLKPKAKRKK